ncbi:Zinc finger protein 446 [Tupaia chinensis]|uniref:Zinc finger protein 446 n=1 Tax=Tupaia chinensis TaxID=246437 RepID=L8Y920_TUPCH|nr:Zinc finger protein 446 [Tupaia chinensis]
MRRTEVLARSAIAHILKQKELPAAQKEESLGNPHSSGIMEPPGSALGEGPQDSGMEEPGQLSCSVKEEPDADVQEMAPPSSMSLAQSPEEHLRHQEPASIPSNPPSIQEQWGLLDPSQKELYWNAMLEKYGTVVSLGEDGLPPEVGLLPRQLAPCPAALPPSFRRGSLAAEEQGPREQAALRSPRRGPGPRSYECEECGRGFSWKSQLVIHRKSHTGQRRHCCRDCGRGFDWKSQLVIHRKSHRPEAP